MNGSEFRPVSTHALVATLSFLALGLMTVISIISTVAEIGLLQQVASGVAVSDADATRNDNRQALIGYVYLGVFAVTVIAFLSWINGASSNLQSLGVRDQRFSPGWAVGAWFVPIVMLFRPYQIMKEIWKGSYPASSDTTAAGWESASVSPLLGFWWAAWLVSNWLSNLVLRQFLSGGTTVDALILTDWINVVSSAISLSAMVMVIVLVRQISANQNRQWSGLVQSGEDGSGAVTADVPEDGTGG